MWIVQICTYIFLSLVLNCEKNINGIQGTPGYTLTILISLIVAMLRTNKLIRTIAGPIDSIKSNFCVDIIIITLFSVWVFLFLIIFISYGTREISNCNSLWDVGYRVILLCPNNSNFHFNSTLPTG